MSTESGRARPVERKGGRDQGPNETKTAQHESSPLAEPPVHPRIAGEPVGSRIAGEELNGERVSSTVARLTWFCRRILASIQHAVGRFAFGTRYRSWRHEEAQGRLMVESGKTEQGVARLLASVALVRTKSKENPDLQGALRRLEAYLQHAEERLEAIYSRSIAACSGTVAVYRGRAELRLRAGDIAEALADYDRALGITPHHPATQLDRGVARYRGGGGDLPGAISDFCRVLEREPTNATAFFNRAFATALDDPESALADMTAARKLGTWPGQWFPTELRLRIAAADKKRVQHGVAFLVRLAEHPSPGPSTVWSGLLADANARLFEFRLSQLSAGPRR